MSLTQSYIFRPVAPYACDARKSLGRLLPEPSSSTRTDFARDRDRIIHSTAFRRLKHKTQVFVEHEGDHYRTRLTHTLEVAQIARSIARPLGLDEDLAECIALSHDLGHPPFGHAGEMVLDDLMRGFGGFDHNAQSLRIVTKLERRYPTFDGLNLTWETREGIVKHNGPLERAKCPTPLLNHNALQDLRLSTFASAEAQAAAVADDIAYNAHDINDGIGSGLLKLNDLRHVPLTKALLEGIETEYPHLDEGRKRHELSRRLITAFVMDVLEHAQNSIKTYYPQSADDVRALPFALVGFSADMKKKEKQLKSFLFEHLYRHPHVAETMEKAKGQLYDLFAHLLAHPDQLPSDWQLESKNLSDEKMRRKVCDYMAGMTDRYVQKLLDGQSPLNR